MKWVGLITIQIHGQKALKTEISEFQGKMLSLFITSHISSRANVLGPVFACVRLSV